MLKNANYFIGLGPPPHTHGRHQNGPNGSSFAINWHSITN